MFPGSPRKRDAVKVIPIGSVSPQIALRGDDPDYIFLEVSGSTFTGATITLPSNAPMGKVFKFALTSTSASGVALTSSVNIIVPMSSGTATKSIWVMYSGQRPTFIYGPTGWLTDAGNNMTNQGSNNLDIAIGNSANGNSYGTAVGYGANGSSNGAAIGYNSNGSPYGAAIGYASNGSSNGAAIGYNSNGSSYGAAIGYNSNGSPYGAAIGYNSNGSSYGAAIGYNSDGSSYGTAVGYYANGSPFGAAIGYNSNGSSNGTAIGYSANGSSNGVAIGCYASANGKDKAVSLGYYSKAQRYRELVKSADGSATCLQSFSILDWYGDTTTATPQEIFLGSVDQRALVLANSAYMFKLLAVARDNVNNVVSAWEITGAIKRDASNNTALVGSVTSTLIAQDAAAAAWAINVTANDTNEALAITVTGAAATTIRWNVRGDISELRF